jgi:hypothetical protein
MFGAIGCTGNKSAGPQLTVSKPDAPSIQVVNAAPSLQASQPCALKLSASPTLAGLKLGMKAEEALAAFPGSKDDPEIKAVLSQPPGEFGVSDLAIRPAKYQKNKANQASPQVGVGEVTRITLTLLDGRAYILQAAYNGPAYSQVDDFVQTFVADKNLPPVTEWQADPGMESQLKILRCAGFEVRVFAGGDRGILNYIAIKDLLAEAKYDERVKKWEAAQSTPTPGQ